MKPFLDDEFLLESATASWLYHEVAEPLPIIDYHCHLPPAEIADDRRFANLTEAWLEGDHYKWRAMRANGIDERFCTGDAEPFEKFAAWAATVPMTLRNPLHHWTHLELRRYFGIDTLLDAGSAREIWDEACRQLARDSHGVHGLLRRMRVEVVCTTDDPTDDLDPHRRANDGPLETRVHPAFRPDAALALDDVAAWNRWCDRLAAASGVATASWDGLVAALRDRHRFFHEQGCRLSDHGLTRCPARPVDDETAAHLFARARGGEPLGELEQEQLQTRLMLLFGALDAERGWVKQLHLGAMRSVSSRATQRVGPASGFDSIGDWNQAERLARYLDALDAAGELPRTILYNLNPADNYVFASMLGNFNDGSVAGKLQLGSGWWFLDQKQGIEWQLDALSNLGLLSRFVGMLTDSRSFLSYPRHEYFRRILCNVLGGEVERGLIPDDRGLLREYVERICHRNAREYFGLP